jgi:hypothetical protein
MGHEAVLITVQAEAAHSATFSWTMGCFLIVVSDYVSLIVSWSILAVVFLFLITFSLFYLWRLRLITYDSLLHVSTYDSFLDYISSCSYSCIL